MPHSTTHTRPRAAGTHPVYETSCSRQACSPPRAPAEAKEFRLTHPADTPHPDHIEAVEMVKRIAERTKGEVEIKIHPNNELGAPPETTEQIRLGVIDFQSCRPPSSTSRPRLRGRQHSVSVRRLRPRPSHPRPDRERVAEGARAQGRIRADRELRMGLSRADQLATADQLAGRCQGLEAQGAAGDPIKASMEALGANTATIAFPEVYIALATGTVDGQDNPAATVYSQKFFEVQKHLALTRHVYTPMMLVANARTWQRLTPEQRTIVTEEAVKAGNEARRQVQDKDAWYIAADGEDRPADDPARGRPLPRAHGPSLQGDQGLCRRGGLERVGEAHRGVPQ